MSCRINFKHSKFQSPTAIYYEYISRVLTCSENPFQVGKVLNLLYKKNYTLVTTVVIEVKYSSSLFLVIHLTKRMKARRNHMAKVMKIG